MFDFCRFWWWLLDLLAFECLVYSPSRIFENLIVIVPFNCLLTHSMSCQSTFCILIALVRPIQSALLHFHRPVPSLDMRLNHFGSGAIVFCPIRQLVIPISDYFISRAKKLSNFWLRPSIHLFRFCIFYWDFLSSFIISDGFFRRTMWTNNFLSPFNFMHPEHVLCILSNSQASMLLTGFILECRLAAVGFLWSTGRVFPPITHN